MIKIMYAGAKMNIWNLILSDKPDDSYDGEMMSIKLRDEDGRPTSGVTLPRNMAGCLFYIILIILGLWAMTDYSQSLDEPDRVRICASGSIWPWDRCR
jgi:hypothetical protein